MEKKVKIGGKVVVIAFNLATQIKFEEKNGRMPDMDHLTSVSETTLLLLASIEANNEGSDFKAEDLTKRASLKEFEAATSALAESMTEFFRVPEIAESHVAKPEGSEEGEAGKNA